MKKLLYLFLFIPFVSFSQETKNVLNIDTIKEEYIRTTDGITYYNGKPYNGVFISNHDNGQLRRKETYKAGKKDGLLEEYSIKGQLEYKANFKDGKHNGITEQYNKKTGKLEFKINYENHKINGLYEQYYETGELKFKANFKDNKLTGVANRYHKTGQLSRKETYKAGKMNGLREQYYETGELQYKGNYKDGKRDGMDNGYYKTGKLESKANYKDGKKNGFYERYYKNGQLKRKENLKDGKLNGSSKKYDSNGKLVENLIYKDGKIVTNLRLIIGGTNIEDVNVYDLEAMIRLFLKDCEQNNIKLSSDYKITSTFETLDKGVLAKAYGIFNDEEIIIKVNPQDWSQASNPKRWYILYHELGHDVLNLQHGQGGKMMFNYSEKDYYWGDFIKDKDYMFSSMKSK